MAIGTSKGTIKLFKTAYIEQDFAFATLNDHQDEVWAIRFMVRGKDVLMVSVAKDCRLIVTSLVEGRAIFKVDI